MFLMKLWETWGCFFREIFAQIFFRPFCETLDCRFIKNFDISELSYWHSVDSLN